MNLQKHILECLEKGLSLGKGKRILHTAPHHDDIMLGYYPILSRLLEEGDNNVAYITSGTNGVKNEYIDSLENRLQYRQLFDGADDRLEVKARLREYEASSLWKSLGLEMSQIHYMRSAFYYDMANFSNDIVAIGRLLNVCRPHVVTLALDPKEQGPKMHFKTLLALLRALEGREVEVWGYRNVWSRYAIDEANVMLFCSEEEIHNMEKAFNKCFKSQVETVCPKENVEMSFSQASAKIMREQYDEVKKILGEAFFLDSESPEVRNAKALIFLRVLPAQTLIKEFSHELSLT